MKRTFYGRYLAAFCSALFLSCGGSTNQDSPKPLKNPDQYSYTYSVLSSGEKGYADGKIAEAKFNRPYAITIDGQDNLYIVDRGNYAIRIVKPDGTVSTLKDNLGKKLETNYQVESIKIDAKSNVYLTEFNTVARITSTGEKTTLCGTLFGYETFGYKDDKGDKARLNGPHGLVIGLDNDLYVTEISNKLIRKVAADGTVSTYAGTAKTQTVKDGSLQTATFSSPSGLSMDGQGNFYLSEYYSNVVRKITTDGQVKTIAGNLVAGYADGKGEKAMFSSPKGIFATKEGYVFVADGVNNGIRLIAPDGTVTTLYKGQQSLDGTRDVTVDSKGNVYFVIPGSNTIAKLTAK